MKFCRIIGSVATVVSFSFLTSSCGDENYNSGNSSLSEFEIRGKFSAAEENSSKVEVFLWGAGSKVASEISSELGNTFTFDIQASELDLMRRKRFSREKFRRRSIHPEVKKPICCITFGPMNAEPASGSTTSTAFFDGHLVFGRWVDPFGGRSVASFCLVRSGRRNHNNGLFRWLCNRTEFHFHPRFRSRYVSGFNDEDEKITVSVEKTKIERVKFLSPSPSILFMIPPPCSNNMFKPMV